MKLTLERKVAGVFGLALATIVGMGALEYRYALRLGEDYRWVSHSQDISRDLQALRRSINGADAAAQSFVISGDPTTLQRYYTAISNQRQTLRLLRKLTADNPAQQQRLDRVEPHLDAGIRALQEEIDSRRTNRITVEKLLALEQTVRTSLDDGREVISEMEAHELDLLRQRREDAEQTNQETKLSMVSGTLTALFLLGAAMALLLLEMKERRRAEEALRTSLESQSKQAQLLDLADDAIFVRDLDFTILAWYRGAEKTYGWSKEEAQGKIAREFLQAAFPEPVEEITRKILAHGSWEGEIKQTKRDGTRIAVASRHTLQRDAEGRPVAVLMINRDISERKRAEEALYLETEVTAAASTAADIETAFSLALERICRLKDWRLGQVWMPARNSEVLVCAPRAFYSEIDLPEFRKISLESPFEKGVGLPGRVWKSMAPAWVADVTQDTNFPRAEFASRAGLHGAIAFPVKLHGKLVAVLEFFSPEVREPEPQFLEAMERLGRHLGEVLERKRAVAALALSEEHYRSILETANDAFISMDGQGIITEWNSMAETIFGWSREEILGRKLDETIIPPEHRQAHREGLRRFISTGMGRILNRRVEMTALRRDGTTFPVELTVWPISSAGVWSFNAFVHDITERKRAEEAVRSLSGRLLTLQDEERRHISRELHDGTLQTLSAMAIKFALLNERASVGQDPAAAQALAEGLALADQACREVRTFSYLLHPPLLDVTGLRGALQWYVEGFTKRTSISVQLESPPELGQIPRNIETALFRIAQECLTNVHRHSESPTAEVRLTHDGNRLCLEVRDHGKGFPAGFPGESRGAPVPLGVGIQGMQERVRQLGGELKFSAAEPGTFVRAVLPWSGDRRA